MNASYNDQQKQVNPVSSTWQDFGVLSKTSLKSGGLILKLTSSLLTGRHVFFTDFLFVCFSIRTPNTFSQFYFYQPRTQGQYQVNWDHGYKSFVNVSHFPYHLCTNRTFSISEENLYFLQSKNGIRTMKTEETLNLHFNFPFSFLKET